MVKKWDNRWNKGFSVHEDMDEVLARDVLTRYARKPFRYEGDCGLFCDCLEFFGLHYVVRTQKTEIKCGLYSCGIIKSYIVTVA